MQSRFHNVSVLATETLTSLLTAYFSSMLFFLCGCLKATGCKTSIEATWLPGIMKCMNPDLAVEVTRKSHFQTLTFTVNTPGYYACPYTIANKVKLFFHQIFGCKSPKVDPFHLGLIFMV